MTSVSSIQIMCGTWTLPSQAPKGEILSEMVGSLYSVFSQSSLGAYLLSLMWAPCTVQ